MTWPNLIQIHIALLYQTNVTMLEILKLILREVININ